MIFVSKYSFQSLVTVQIMAIVQFLHVPQRVVGGGDKRLVVTPWDVRVDLVVNELVDRAVGGLGNTSITGQLVNLCNRRG